MDSFWGSEILALLILLIAFALAVLMTRER